MPFGIGHPPSTHQLQSTCVREGSRVPNLQTEFNYLDSFKSYGIFSDFVVPMVPTSSPSSPHHPHSPRRSPCGPNGLWSLWSPHVVPVVSTCPHGPHIIPVIPVSSRSSPHHPHSPQVVPMVCGPRGLHVLSPWSAHVVFVVSTCCLCGPTSFLSSLCHPCHPHIVPIAPRMSPWSVVSTCCPRGPHVVPVIPMSSPLSPHHLEDHHIISNPPDTHSTHPPPPWGWGALNQ